MNEDRLRRLGFVEEESGVYTVRGCRVSLYRDGDTWTVEIATESDLALRSDVLADALGTTPTYE